MPSPPFLFLSCCVGTHLDHHSAGCVTVEAKGLGPSPLQYSRRRRIEARVDDARMMPLYLFFRGKKKANVEEGWVGAGGNFLVVRENESEAVFTQQYCKLARPALLGQ